ncbi:MAG: transcriptional regulator [Dethiobacteria bacterium]|nr:transcriptional regulator [Bacillota bacterium]MDW7729586.1 transcriptional regulator [Bacillota bacterium]
MKSDRVFRIGEKLISLNKAVRVIERALEIREHGSSQQEAASRLQLDRSFLSRLESIGEIRKGNRVAVIGFPVSNGNELKDICHEFGLDFFMILNNRERWELVTDKQALDFFNSMLELVTRLREFDTLIMITSNKWFHLAEALLDIQIIHLELGPTPIDSDLPVDPEQLKSTIKQVLSKE